MKKTIINLSNPQDSEFSGLIGTDSKDITPQVGIYSRNWGAAKQNIASGIHKALYLNCVTLQESHSTPLFVMITMDLGWWKSTADEKQLRNAIIREFQLEESNLMICLSHTHAGPVIFSEEADKEGGTLIAPYLELIKDQAIQSIKDALTMRTLSTLTWQYGTCDLATNRDLPDPEGDGYLVGYNPDLPADNTLLVGRITDSDKNIIGTIVNYACHPTTLAWENQLISPDYVGAMRELIAEMTNQSPCLFLQGASGELAPSIQYTGDCSVADQHGRKLGYAVLSVLESMRPANTKLIYQRKIQSGAPLAIWAEEIQQPTTILRGSMVNIPMTLKPLDSLAEIEFQLSTCTDPVMKERLWRLRGIRKTIGDEEKSAMPLWVWRIGEVVLAGQPNEPYSDFQTILRKHFYPRKIAVMNIVNGSGGYLPPAEMYNRDQYSVWQTPFESGSLEQLISTTLSEITKIINDQL